MYCFPLGGSAPPRLVLLRFQIASHSFRFLLLLRVPKYGYLHLAFGLLSARLQTTLSSADHCVDGWQAMAQAGSHLQSAEAMKTQLEEGLAAL